MAEMLFETSGNDARQLFGTNKLCVYVGRAPHFRVPAPAMGLSGRCIAVGELIADDGTYECDDGCFLETNLLGTPAANMRIFFKEACTGPESVRVMWLGLVWAGAQYLERRCPLFSTTGKYQLRHASRHWRIHVRVLYVPSGRWSACRNKRR